LALLNISVRECALIIARKDILQKHGSLDHYFSEKLGTKAMVQHSSLSCIAIDNRLMNLTDFSFDQEKVLAFLQWLDTSFPADPSVSAPKL